MGLDQGKLWSWKAEAMKTSASPRPNHTPPHLLLPLSDTSHKFLCLVLSPAGCIYKAKEERVGLLPQDTAYWYELFEAKGI